jgi:hypothetical protein
LFNVMADDPSVYFWKYSLYIKGTAAEWAGVGMKEAQEVYDQLSVVVTMHFYTGHQPPAASVETRRNAWHNGTG